MSTVLTTNTALGVTPEWTSESLDALGSTPGSASVDFVVNAFSPKYLGSGTDVNGLLCTQTGVAKIAGIGGTEAFSGLLSFGDTIATRQMQGSICSEGWYIVASYDATNGTRVRYTTNGGTSWSSYVTVSSGVNGSGWMPGLWMSQKTPGLAVVTGFTGDFPAPPEGTDFCHAFDFRIDDGGWSANGSTSWQSGEGWKGYSFYNQFGGTFGWEKLCSIYRSGDEPFDPTRVIMVYSLQRGTSATGNVAIGTVIVSHEFSAGEVAAGSVSHGATVTDYMQTQSTFVQLDGNRMDKLILSLRGADFSAGAVGSATATITQAQVCGIGTDPYSDHQSASSTAAFVTTDYGATWTEISSAATVGYIQPGTYLSGCIEAPYTDASPQRFVYGSMNTSGTYPVPRLHRVSGTTVTDISPSYDGKTYGVPYSAPHRRAICISVTDANTAILCGESRNATSGTSVYRVFLTRNLWSAAPTWTPLSDESATVEWRGAYIAGNTSNVAYFLGSNGNFGYWNTSKAAATIFDRKGDSTNSSSAVGLCGI